MSERRMRQTKKGEAVGRCRRPLKQRTAGQTSRTAILRSGHLWRAVVMRNRLEPAHRQAPRRSLYPIWRTRWLPQNR
jgi:hypothetical protein